MQALELHYNNTLTDGSVQALELHYYNTLTDGVVSGAGDQLSSRSCHRTLLTDEEAAGQLRRSSPDAALSNGSVTALLQLLRSSSNRGVLEEASWACRLLVEDLKVRPCSMRTTACVPVLIASLQRPRPASTRPFPTHTNRRRDLAVRLGASRSPAPSQHTH